MSYETRKSYVPTALKINASIKKNHWTRDMKEEMQLSMLSRLLKD